MELNDEENCKLLNAIINRLPVLLSWLHEVLAKLVRHDVDHCSMQWSAVHKECLNAAGRKRRRKKKID